VCIDAAPTSVGADLNIFFALPGAENMTTTSVRPAGAQPPKSARATISAKTLRTDRWWFKPAYTVTGLTLWVAWAVVHTLVIKDYYFAQGPGYHYLTPFFSPCVSVACAPEAAEFGRWAPDWWFLPYAVVSLPFLLLFRLTCYYYRQAYYRSFWLSPPACAVPDGHKRYTGETRFPLVFQNLHRYAFYAAVLVSLVNTWDMLVSFHGTEGFGFGLGNVVLLVNVILLWAYMPLLPAHPRRAAQALLQAPAAVPQLDAGVQTEHSAQGAGLDYARHARADRHLYPGDLRRLVPRPAVLQLRA
jgi:hypothetical protein